MPGPKRSAEGSPPGHHEDLAARHRGAARRRRAHGRRSTTRGRCPTSPRLAPDDRIPFYWVIEGFGLWGVMLFFMLSGYLLADTFWRVRAGRPAGLRDPAVLPDRAGLLRDAWRSCSSSSPPTGWSSASRARSSSWSTRRSRSTSSRTTPARSTSTAPWWTLTIELLLYAFLPLMALLVRFNPWIGTAAADRRSGWAGAPGSPSTATGCVAQYFDGPSAPTTASRACSSPASSSGQSRSSPSASWPAGWWCTATSTGSTSGCPARLGVSSFMVLMLPSIALLYWVERGTLYTNRVLFTIYDFGLMVVLLPALLLAARPQQFVASPLRSVSTWLGERSYSIYLWHFPIILAIYERGPLKHLPSGRRLLVAAARDSGRHPGVRLGELPPGRTTGHGVRPQAGQTRLPASQGARGHRLRPDPAPRGDVGIPEEAGAGFDLAIAADVLEHLRNSDAMLREIGSRLGKGAGSSSRCPTSATGTRGCARRWALRLRPAGHPRQDPCPVLHAAQPAANDQTVRDRGLPVLALVLDRLSVYGVSVVDNAIYFHLPTVLVMIGVLEPGGPRAGPGTSRSA